MITINLSSRIAASQTDFCYIIGHELYGQKVYKKRHGRRFCSSSHRNSRRWTVSRDALTEKQPLRGYMVLQSKRTRLFNDIMKLIIKRRLLKRILIGTALLCIVIFIIVFIILPIVYKYSYSLQRNLLFLNFVYLPVNFKNPKSVGLSVTRNFYITTEDNVTLGVWQILPASRILNFDVETATSSDYEKALADGRPIFLYMHGNSGNRGSGHRVELYKKLQNNNYHIIAFDYRSYGDSSSVEPSETGVVTDSKAVFKWIRSHAKGSKIFFWGHSLGTGISSHLLDILESEGEHITGLILEAPFNNIVDEVRSYPMAKIYSFLPWFDYFFTDPLYDNGLRFETDKHLVRVKAPILILHAEDDLIIPVTLGHKLYKILKEAKVERSLIKFVKYEKKYNFGHKFIYRDNELNKKIRDFVEESSNFKAF